MREISIRDTAKDYRGARATREDHPKQARSRCSAEAQRETDSAKAQREYSSAKAQCETGSAKAPNESRAPGACQGDSARPEEGLSRRRL